MRLVSPCAKKTATKKTNEQCKNNIMPAHLGATAHGKKSPTASGGQYPQAVAASNGSVGPFPSRPTPRPPLSLRNIRAPRRGGESDFGIGERERRWPRAYAGRRVAAHRLATLPSLAPPFIVLWRGIFARTRSSHPPSLAPPFIVLWRGIFAPRQQMLQMNAHICNILRKT